MRFQSIGIALLTLAMSSAASARAEPSPEVRQERVGYADLDLTTREGERILLARLRKAVHDVCTEPGSLDGSLCERDAMRRAARDAEAARRAAAGRLAEQGARRR